MPSRVSGKSPSRPGQWLRLALIIVLLGIGLYSTWQRQQNQEQPHLQAPARGRQTSEQNDLEHNEPAQKDLSAARTTIARQTIRNEDGRVVFRGDIDMGPTLDRINRGERLEFTHDGIVFQNRERQLPSKPAGYYHEYVHPTPGIAGPGPQRIVRGRNGETYYTPDHYRTFQRLDE
jgi:guanyl-specific ribonuclease Sa